jgi:hypothetical protein
VYPKLRLAHFAAVLPPESGLDAEKALALFDTNADGMVELPEFVAACEDVYAELRALKASLSGHQSVSTAMQSLLDVVFWLLLTFLALLIWQVSVVDVYVPLGTVLVSASFAIGASLSQIVSSLIFVLVTRPYNVGDRVTASGVFNGDETLIVKKVRADRQPPGAGQETRISGLPGCSGWTQPLPPDLASYSPPTLPNPLSPFLL